MQCIFGAKTDRLTVEQIREMRAIPMSKKKCNIQQMWHHKSMGKDI